MAHYHDCASAESRTHGGFLVDGQQKAKVLRSVLFGPADPQRLPAQLIAPEGRLLWFVDAMAAGLLPRTEERRRGIALRFAAEGADGAFCYLGNRSGAEQVIASITGEGAGAATGRRALPQEIDVRDTAQVQTFITTVFEHFGTADVMVNDAGVERRAAFWDVTEDEYDLVLDVNLKGVFFTTQAVVRCWMAAKRPGKIINISSVHEELPFPHFAPYCASKGGLKILTRDLAVELAPYGITINNIAPGAIETPINKALLNDPAKLQPLLQSIPLKRLGKPDDVAGVTAFLASADADYITGTTVFVDGGLLWSYEEQ